MKKGFMVSRREHIQRPDAEWDRGREGMRKERRKVTRESPRFPEVLTLPQLVSEQQNIALCITLHVLCCCFH